MTAVQDSLRQRMGILSEVIPLPDAAGWMPEFPALDVAPEWFLRKTGFSGIATDMGDLGRLMDLASGPGPWDNSGFDVKRLASDHFSLQKKALDKAMAEVERYKDKFHALEGLPKTDLGFINTMRGKPLAERLVPGTWLRMVQRSGPQVEFAPFFRYRLTGRVSLGLGWNGRFSWVNGGIKLIASGPLLTTVARVGRNYEVLAEYRWMTTHSDGEAVRFTNWFTGLRKVFRVTRSINGFAAVQYDLNRRSLQLTPGDRLQTRMGVELRLQVKDKVEHTTFSSVIRRTEHQVQESLRKIFRYDFRADF